MKAVKLLLNSFVVIFIMASISLAADFKAEQPFLITPAGQSSDALMIKILAQKADLKYTYDKLVTAEKLKDFKTLILVSGGSTKGLGAANIDKEQELARVKALIKEAKKNKMPIITMHVGGKKRRGKLSNEFNTLSAENSDCLVILKDGDEDNFFANMAKEKKIPIIYINKILEAKDVLTKIFN